MYYIYKEQAYLAALKAANRLPSQIQSRTKLLEKVFPIMSTFLHNKTISKTTPLQEENPFPQFNVASHKRPGIRLSFEYTTTLLLGEGGEGRTGTATIFTKMLSKYTIFSTVLSKIVERQYNFLGFDLNMPSGPKSYRDFPTRVLQKIRCSFTTSILVKITQIIWRSVCIQMDFYINFAYFTWVKMYPDRRFCPFPFILPQHPHPHPPLLIYPPKQNLSRQALDIAV